MFDIFSTREIATAFYLLFLLFIMLCSKQMRQGIMDVIKAACTKKLVIPFVLLLSYAVILIWTLSKLSFWKNLYMKDIIIWVLFVGVPVSFNVVSKGGESHYFRDILAANIKLTVIVEFLFGTFTFNIIVELIMQPIIIFFVLLQMVSEQKAEYIKVKKLLDWILAIIGLIILGFTIRAACGAYQEINAIDTVISFCIPIVFSLFYIPVAYIFGLWTKYEIIFMKMRFKEPKDKKVIRKHRKAVLKACKFSIKKAYSFEKECIKNMYVFMNEEEFDVIIRGFEANNNFKNK